MRPIGPFWGCSRALRVSPAGKSFRRGVRWTGWVLLLLLTACTDPAPAPEAAEPDGEWVSLEAKTRLPRFGTGQGRLLLSYLAPDSVDGYRLLMREHENGAWSDAREVAAGVAWFVNWADYPSVKPLGTGEFFHYLAYSGEGTYDYDIRFGTGNTPATGDAVLHTDGISAEHGFLSSAHHPDGSLRVSWLDGRFTKQDGAVDHHAHGHAGGGAMTLRTARVHPDGSVTDREELDHRVCDCCNTATAVAGDRTMVVYRDRSEREIRDIYYVLADERGEWSSPQPVFEDGWEVTGCPVNGPAVAANAGGGFAVAWYTAAAGRPRIQFARYDTLTARFSPPVLLDSLNSLGRVDVKLADDGTAYVLGMASGGGEDGSVLMLWEIDQGGTVIATPVAEVSADRSAGFPRLALDRDSLWIAYTDTERETVRLRGWPRR